MLFKNKSDFIVASIVTLSVVFSSITLYIFTKDISTFFWDIFFCFFIIYFRVGVTKKQQILHVICYSLLTFSFITIVGISTLVHNQYYIILFATLIFLPLCVSRYVAGGRVIGVFITVYVLVFYSLYPHLYIEHLKSILIDIFCGLSFALFFTTSFIYLLPFIKIPIIPRDKSLVLLKQSFRVALCITIAYFVMQIYHLNNPLWVYLSIVIINQTHLGLSVKKAVERLFGTIIGAIVGAVMGGYLFEVHPLSLYFCIIVVFLTYYYIRLNYLLAVFFVTILVTASFYLLKPSVTLYEFIYNRVIDTLVGLSIGVLGEVLIFPQSLLQIIRLNLKQSFQIMSEIFLLLEKQTNIEAVNYKITLLDSLRAEFTENLKTIRHELITHIAKRYSYIHDVYSYTHSIHKTLKQIVKENTSNINPLVFNHLTQAMQLLYNVYPKLQLNESDLYLVLANLKVSLELLSDDYISKLIKQLINSIIKLFKLYQIVIATPRFKPKWNPFS